MYLDLAGIWQLRLDPQDLGEKEKWFDQSWEEADQLQLPGSLQQQGFGNPPALDTNWTGQIVDKRFFSDPQYAPYREPENLKFPFWLQPDRCYRGAAWYRKTFLLPEAHMQESWMIALERAHWTTRLWIDGKEIGFADSLSTPQYFEFTPSSRKVTVTLCVDNRMWVDVGPNAHSMTDHTQTNWNGVIGTLRAFPKPVCSIRNLQLFPDPENHQLRICGDLSNSSPLAENTILEIRIGGVDDNRHCPPPFTFTLTVGSEASIPFDFNVDLGPEMQPWHPGNPALYELEIGLNTHPDPLIKNQRFGMVKVGRQGTQITLNGQPVFLRGALDCAVFPKTGTPATDVESWRRIFETCKAHGLNHIRFHSWCPPEAAFVAGDETGIIFQVECATWPNTTSRVGEGDPVDQWLYEEGKRIVEHYGNHPCFLLMACGNEPAGPGEIYGQEYDGMHDGADYMGPWCEYWTRKDPRRLHAASGGWPRVKQSGFHNVPEPRIQRWAEELDSIINAQPPRSDYDWSDLIAPDKPTVSHEIGQWCAYPDFSEIAKTSSFLKAKNFEIFRDFLAKAGMAEQAADFVRASGRLQTLCYKAEIEAALRTPGFGGFQLLGLQDFPGQGTAPVGVLNAFWEEKGYCAPEEYREFCEDLVPLAALPRHLFRAGKPFEVPLLLSQFCGSALPAGELIWELRSKQGEQLLSGRTAHPQLASGQLHRLGEIRETLPASMEPCACELVLTLPAQQRCNRWSVFVYPTSVAFQDTPTYTLFREWTAKAGAALAKGENVWLQLLPEMIDTEIKNGFSSIFWNTAWTKNQAPHTLGILCDPEHPAFAQFPSEAHSDWQWWGACTHSRVMETDRVSPAIRPLIQMVPDWFAPKKLALAFEVSVGPGRLLVTSIDFERDTEADPARLQLRDSLSAYLSSPAFQPEVDISPDTISRLLKQN